MLHYFKMAILGLFFIYFLSFQTNNTNFTQINVKNIHPVSGAGIKTSDYESPPLTTRPGHPPSIECFKINHWPRVYRPTYVFTTCLSPYLQLLNLEYQIIQELFLLA